MLKLGSEDSLAWASFQSKVI
jgi:hypothetical protein